MKIFNKHFEYFFIGKFIENGSIFIFLNLNSIIGFVNFEVLKSGTISYVFS